MLVYLFSAFSTYLLSRNTIILPVDYYLLDQSNSLIVWEVPIGSSNGVMYTIYIILGKLRATLRPFENIEQNS